MVSISTTKKIPINLLETCDFNGKSHTVHDPHEEIFLHDFLAFASELLENREEMFPRYLKRK